MTLLVISPDYASHLLPLATLATAWRDAGERVVVATGPATADIVAEFGFERAELSLGRGSNPGVIRVEQQPAGEDEALRGFFAATRRGMVATLRFQAEARRADLLYDPVGRGRQVLRLIETVQPDEVLVDHLAFSARLALTAAGVAHGDVVLGHPSALPVGGEVYGYPTAWPAVLTPPAAELADLRRLCDEVRAAFTAEWNAALRTLAPGAGPVADAFTTHGDPLLLNYPEQLHDPARTALLPPHTFLGSAVRAQPVPDDILTWLDGDDRPVIYVSFGSFLSARDDVLGTVIEALRPLDVRAAVATGSAARLPEAPAHWLVRPHLPQVALLRSAVLAVTHGGNNSVTEALTVGVPMVVLPFSTDQFAGAAAIGAAGLGVALDPHAASPGGLRAAVRDVLDGPAPGRARELAAALRETPGPERARAAFGGHRAGRDRPHRPSQPPSTGSTVPCT